MYLFCTQCQTQFPATGRCPRCSSRLLAPGEAVEVYSTKSEAARPAPKPITLLNRVFVGSVLALGLYAGLREWALAAISLTGESTNNLSLYVGFALRCLCAMFGGLLAGTSREGGFNGGFAVGIVSGFAWLCFDQYPNITLDIQSVGLATLLATTAGIAAVVSGRIWPPRVDLPMPESGSQSSILKLIPEGKSRERTEHTHWIQILVSSTLVLTAILCADPVRQRLKSLPASVSTQIRSVSVASKVDFQIAVVGVLIGGILAGASTGNGLKHGLISATLSSCGTIGLIRWKGLGDLPALEYLAELLKIADSPMLGIGGTIFITSSITGWLGGQMFPKLRARKRLQALD